MAGEHSLACACLELEMLSIVEIVLAIGPESVYPIT
jgi:hypothetical protein